MARTNTQEESVRAAAKDAMVSSPLDELRAEFAVEAAKQRLYKRLPARSGRLAAEYKAPPLAAAKKAQADDSDADILIAGLERILIYAPEHPDAIPSAKDGAGLVPLGAWAGQPELDPLRFDNRLAELIGIPKGTSREIVLAMFEGNDLALGIQAGELGTWGGEGYDKALQDFGSGS